MGRATFTVRRKHRVRVVPHFRREMDGEHSVHVRGFFKLSSSVIPDSAGNLYGTTYGGGAYKDGAVFEVTP